MSYAQSQFSHGFCSGFSIAIATTNGTLYMNCFPFRNSSVNHLFKGPNCFSSLTVLPRAILCSTQKWTSCFSPLFCVIFVVTCSLKQYHLHSVLHEHTSFSFCQQLSLTYGFRARQRKCIISRYPQFSISSPQIYLTINFYIAHILKSQSLLFLTQFTNAGTLPWELLYSPCSLSSC